MTHFVFVVFFAVMVWGKRGSRLEVTEEEPHNLRIGVPYIIKSMYPGWWQGAELSWSSTSKYPSVKLKFDDPVAWQLYKYQGYYMVQSLHPGNWHETPLTWHGVLADTFGDANARCRLGHDTTPWEIKRNQQNHSRYTIVNRFGGPGWANFGKELSWDCSWCWRPLVTIENNDPVEWEITPAYTITGKWVWSQSIAGVHGSGKIITHSWGTVRSTSWSKSETFSHTVAASVQVGFEIEGISASTTVTQSVTEELSHSVAAEVQQSYGMQETDEILKGPNNTNIFVFHLYTKSNHHAHQRDRRVRTVTKWMATTPSKGMFPKCWPGYCITGTGCQTCHDSMTNTPIHR